MHPGRDDGRPEDGRRSTTDASIGTPWQRHTLAALEARRLTDEVKRDAVALREKLLRLYEGGAHVALGYLSWRAYWEAEFESHWRTGYRELDAARVDRAIGQMANGPLPESQARELAPLLDDEAELVEVWRELRAEHGGRVTAEKVRAAVSERLRRETLNGSLTSSETFEWYTPAFYLDAARRVMGGIDLDPASCPPANETVRAEVFYTAEDDGLSRDWFGRVWLNPPYGRLCPAFVAKLAAEYEDGRVDEAILLVNAYSTETMWFQPLLRRRVVCFAHRRINFTSPAGREGTPTHGSAFVYFGDRPTRFATMFQPLGVVVSTFEGMAA